ncbi:hypothetical protein BT69DRAFT_129579 [Atractiella rhizophila]|nr:hypothetical protein BT69DRAFT_129579 [Atractiella rhizophila]
MKLRSRYHPRTLKILTFWKDQSPFWGRLLMFPLLTLSCSLTNLARRSPPFLLNFGLGVLSFLTILPLVMFGASVFLKFEFTFLLSARTSIAIHHL